MKRQIVALTMVVSLLAVVGNAWGVVQYTVTDLGTLPGGNWSAATDINSFGQVVGYSTATVKGYHAFLSNNGTMTDLGSLGSYPSFASGINASGQIVGYAQNAVGNAYAFVYANGATSDLGTLPGYSSSRAYAINDGGQVAGCADGGSNTPSHAFLYSNGTMSDLGTFGGSSSKATDLNTSGQVIGWANTASGSEHAFRYSNGTMTDLGTLGGSSSEAFGINAGGQVVGESYTSSIVRHAFLYSNGTMTDMGTLPGFSWSWATDINANGQVVGYDYNTSGGIREHAFVHSHGTTTDLNNLIDAASGWILYQANAINDSGWIVGYGNNPSGQEHAFLLAPIPEPSTLVLLGVGAIGFLAWAWRRRWKLHGLSLMVLAMAVVLSTGMAQAADVFNMGGTRNPTTGTWTGLASLDFVTVGDPGNAADTATGSHYGSVGYVYQIGKYDVTVGQYRQFLNAVAKTDTYGLYNSYLAAGNPNGYPTIGITQSGSPGSYSYSVGGSYSQAANCPIFDITLGDAARFCNWLQNGQPTGAEGPGTTETGAYTLNGAVSYTALMAVNRNAGATYFIPSLNEWYKAAYYKAGGTAAGYWTYPTKSDAAPSNVLSPTGTNNANFYKNGLTDPTNDLTPVGAFAASPGPYGTFDMGGDVFQWNETAVTSAERGIRGGCWDGTYDTMATSDPFATSDEPARADMFYGFRFSPVPEPSTLVLLGIGAIGLLGYGWRRRWKLHGLSSMILAVAVVCYAVVAQAADTIGYGGLALLIAALLRLVGVTVRHRRPSAIAPSGLSWKVMSGPSKRLIGPVTVLLLAVCGEASAATTYQWVKNVGTSGSANERLNYLTWMAIDSAGDIWVTDCGNKRVVEYDSNGGYIQQVGTGRFDFPEGLAIDSSGNVWVADAHYNTVQKFNSSGQYVNYLGGSGGLSYPEGVLADTSGNIWVANWGSSSVAEFNSNRQYVGSFGGWGTGVGQFEHAAGVARDSSGNFWVSDVWNNRIEEFSSSGQYIMQFGMLGSGAGQLHSPMGVAVDSSNNIWVADYGNSRIEEFSNTGQFIAQIGSYGTGNGQFIFPNDVAVDSSGNLWVVDGYSNYRIEEFSPTPEPSTLVLLGVGAIGLLAWAWRRRRA